MDILAARFKKSAKDNVLNLKLCEKHYSFAIKRLPRHTVFYYEKRYNYIMNLENLL